MSLDAEQIKTTSTKDEHSKIAGALLFIGGVQWFLAIILAEGLHPGYNSAVHYVSSLGVDVTSLFYNASLLIMGASIVAGAFLIWRALGSRLFFVLLTITGLATLGVGLFPENVRPLHGIVTPIALLFGGMSAIASYRLQEPPLSYVSVLLGALSLAAGIIFNPYLGLPRESTITYLGLGKGTMERLVIYPILLWIIGFGSHLAGSIKRN
jgi:hypothetical membrane protein